MALNKYKLGRFIEKLDNKNSDLKYGVEYAVGVSNEKELMPTKADLNGRNLAKFSIIYPGDFVYNHRTSRHGDKFCIAYNTTQENLICTEDYTIFRIKDDCKNKLLNEYLYMFFHRPEMDRFVMYSSWGSSTEFFNWDDVCDIDIELPDLATQQKYVDVYKAMIANQQSYERGLEDLKLVCDGYIEELRKTNTCESIAKYIELVDDVNTEDSYTVDDVLGVSKEKTIIPTKSKVSVTDLPKFTIIRNNDFIYNPRNGIAISLYKGSESKLISFNNTAFRVKNEAQNILLEDYLFLFFKRKEWDRKVAFDAWGSSTEVYSFNSLCETKIPIVDYSIQKAVANIGVTLEKRTQISEMLKTQIKNICPILIKGSLEECK